MAACGGGRQRQPVGSCQTTRAARRRAAPAAHMRPRPAGRTTPAQKRHPRAKQTAGARRVRPRTSQQNFLFCAPVCGLVHKTPILLIWLVGPRRRAAQSNPWGFGGRDPRSSAGSGGRSMGGYYDTPPMGALCFVLRENHQKKFVTVADVVVFFAYVHQIIAKIGFFVVVPPPYQFGEFESI